MRARLAEAVAAGQAGDRLWLYATYHCNLACAYCLTESHPRIADRRELDPQALVEAVREARDLGFASAGVTGGEVLMLRWFPEVLHDVAALLPTIALTNGALLTPRMLDRLDALIGADVAFQLSLDSAEPARNDALRSQGSHAATLETIVRLLDRGHRVRIASTVEARDGDLDRLCELHRELGVPDEDHVVRTIVRRGKAAVEGLGADLEPTDVLPELTLTVEGAFLHPFGPTVRHGVTDLDLRVWPEALPVSDALEAFLDAADRLPVPVPDGAVRNVI